MYNRLLCIFLLALLFSACKQQYKNPHVVIQTNVGDIELELFADKAPKTVGRFLKNVDSGYYNNTTFYRILKDDNQASDSWKARLIQGGMWQRQHKLYTSIPGVAHESTKETGITHTAGTVSLARAEPGTAATEFFICIDDEHGFDYGGKNNADGLGYAAFGRVVGGTNTVNVIYNKAPETDQALTPPIDIYNIVRK